jgi:hypothetical protein
MATPFLILKTLLGLFFNSRKYGKSGQKYHQAISIPYPLQ